MFGPPKRCSGIGRFCFPRFSCPSPLFFVPMRSFLLRSRVFVQMASAMNVVVRLRSPLRERYRGDLL